MVFEDFCLFCKCQGLANKADSNFGGGAFYMPVRVCFLYHLVLFDLDCDC